MLAEIDIHCFYRVYIWFHTVFKIIYILNKSENATSELFATYIQNYAKTKNAIESVSECSNTE